MPEDTYQTAKVAKVLLLMNAGKGREFQGKRLEEIQLTENEFFTDLNDECSDQERDCDKSQSFENQVYSAQNSLPLKNFNCEKSKAVSSQDELEFSEKSKSSANIKRQSKRVSWSKEQKRLILQHFKKHIQQNKLPKKDECLALIAESSKILKGVDWSRIKILIYNSYRKK